MTPWRWTAYCLFTFALAVLAFRFAVDPPHMLAVGVAAVVLGVLALVFALNSDNNGGPLSSRAESSAWRFSRRSRRGRGSWR